MLFPIGQPAPFKVHVQNVKKIAGFTEIQSDQINMTVCFWYRVVKLLYTRTLDNSLFTRYQKHTAMFNWSRSSTEIGGEGAG